MTKVETLNSWDSRDVVDRIGAGAVRLDRALLIVRRDPDGNIDFFKKSVSEALGVREFLWTDSPREFDFKDGARFLSKKPSLFLIEAPRTKRDCSPRDFFANVRTLAPHGASLINVLPVLVVAKDWAYSYQKGANGIDVPLENGQALLEQEAREGGALILSTSRAERDWGIEYGLRSIRGRRLSSTLKFP